MVGATHPAGRRARGGWRERRLSTTVILHAPSGECLLLDELASEDLANTASCATASLRNLRHCYLKSEC